MAGSLRMTNISSAWAATWGSSEKPPDRIERMRAGSGTLYLQPDRGHEVVDLRHGSHMVNALVLSRFGDERPIPWRQAPMTQPKHAIALEGAPEHGTVLGPAFGSCEKALHEALGDPPKVREQRQIDVDQGVGRRETLPGRLDAAE